MTKHINVRVETISGRLQQATSPDVPGLFITSEDPAELRRITALAAADMLGLPQGQFEATPTGSADSFVLVVSEDA